MKLHVVHVPKLAIARGDVIECPGHVTPADRKLLERAIRKLWPRHPCLILTEGAQLKIGYEIPKA